MTNIWQGIRGLDPALRFRGLIIAAYIWVVSSVHVLSVTIDSPVWATGVAIVAALGFSLVMGCSAVLVVRKLPCVQGGTRACSFESNRLERLLHFAQYFLVALLFFGIWLFAYWPGGFSPDSVVQGGQVVSGRYSDWHPVVYTLVAYALPYKVFGSFDLAAMMQVVEISLCVAYLSSTLEMIGGRAWGWGSVLFISINPGICSAMTYPWKDVAFAGLAALLLSFSLRTFVSRGLWLQSPFHATLFVVTVVFTTLVRHNAILFTAPVMLSALILLRKKMSIVLVVCTIVALLVVKGPLYCLMNVENPGSRASETLGLPMTILGNCMHESPDALDAETRDFLTSVLPESTWREDWKLSNGYNSVKYKDANNSAIDEAGPIAILSMTARSFISCNGPATRGLTALPRIVVDPDGPFYNVVPGQVADNDLGFSSSHHRMVEGAVSSWSTIVRSGFLKYGFLSTGLMLLVPFVIAVGRWRHPMPSQVLLFSGVYTYAFGTAILLTGADHRFFTVVLMLAPAMVCVSLFAVGGPLTSEGRERCQINADNS